MKVMGLGEGAAELRLARVRAWPFWAQVAVVVVGYFVVARLGLLLAFVQTNASPLWPPAGLALASMLVFGPRIALGIGLGAALVNATTGVPWWNVVAMGAGNGLEAMTAYWLLGRWRFRPTLESHRDFLTLAGAAAAAGVVSATLGVGALLLSGGVSGELFVSVWLIWWVGNVLGVVTTTPVILTFLFPLHASGERRSTPRRLEAVVLVASTASVAAAVFLTTFRSGVLVLAALLVSVPLLLWAALRFGVRAAALAVVGESVLAVWGTAHGLGPFAWLAASEADRSVALELFIAVVSLSTLTVATVLDERLRLQSAIQASEEQYRLIVTGSLDGLITIDGDDIVTGWNPQAAHIFGWSAAEMIGRPLVEVIVPPEYRSAHLSGLARYRETGAGPILGRRMELEGLHRDGRTLPVELAVTPLGAGRGVQFVASVRDLSAERDAADALAETQAKGQSVLDTAVDAIITIDEAGVVESVNAAAERLFGFGAAEMIGQNIKLLMPEPYHSEHDGYLERYRETGERHVIGAGREVQGRRRNGSVFDIDLAVSEVQLGNRRAFTGIARDITGRKAAETDLARAARRMTVAAAVSHEMAEAQLNEPTMLELLARKVAEEFAGDTCVVSVLAADGRALLPAAIANTDPGVERAAATLLTGRTYPLTSPYGIHAADSGEAVVISGTSGAEDRKSVV